MRIKEYLKVIIEDRLTDILRCGDIIWLNHSEYGASLTGVQKFEDDSQAGRGGFLGGLGGKGLNGD